ncbi:aryl-sulfate sulfotransferase [Myxococcota bacterium]|nr:aryl-sulfate sulfotransferase [Myxococcota bacterium]
MRGVCSGLFVAALISSAVAMNAGGGPSLEVDRDEAERLRALGYVDVVEESGVDDGPDGAVVIDPALVQPGLDFFTNAYRCEARLIDANGREIKFWRHTPCWKWVHSVLLPNGHVLALHYSPDPVKTAASTAAVRSLLHLDWDGKILWERKLPIHHDVDVGPDGRIATLTYRHRTLPFVNRKHLSRDDYITILDEKGDLLEEFSIADVLHRAGEEYSFERVKIRLKDGQREIDLLHTNSIEWMRRSAVVKNELLDSPDNVLVCLRHQNVVLVIDTKKRELVWSWGRNQLSGPHDASLLDNGNLLIFDNGLGRQWSRVVEVDPSTGEIVWQYRAEVPTDFFTDQRGASQRLPNGNTLVTNSQSGMAFEVTRDGKRVWEYRNPERTEGGKRTVIVRMRRVQESSRPGERFQWSD